MTSLSTQPLYDGVRDIADFPKPGILFKDITPVLLDPALFRLAIAHFVARCRELKPVKIAGIDARGFLFGATVAHELELGFIPVRKKGKLPSECRSLAYDLEYGQAEIEIHTDAVAPGEKIVLVDDLLATGGTARAAVKLIESLGAEVVEAQFLIELKALGGREKLSPSPVYSILSY